MGTDTPRRSVGVIVSSTDGINAASSRSNGLCYPKDGLAGDTCRNASPLDRLAHTTNAVRDSRSTSSRVAAARMGLPSWSVADRVANPDLGLSSREACCGLSAQALLVPVAANTQVHGLSLCCRTHSAFGYRQGGRDSALPRLASPANRHCGHTACVGAPGSAGRRHSLVLSNMEPLMV
jgi:hypothetical protein